MSELTKEIKKYFDDLKCGSNNLITLDDLLKKIEAKENMFMLDIRKKEDYDAGHIKGSFHAEWSEVGEFIEEDVFGKDEQIIVICYSGQTAGQTVGILRAMGYNACSLKGGMVTGSENDNLNIEASCST